ncbi:hypothetical protein [Nocardiopsis algeriensis]|uniref:Uncharacterized protein n=1 Tax=Nocardiopsis algeriensis TaxID=1478215 RepID=A0A841J0Z7_9ACTN|nr:hypothetical protein [Nocardiopsis algeriensis]MBB6122188.1 hypothetical protein [Nocardiopsis algeriensis]
MTQTPTADDGQEHDDARVIETVHRKVLRRTCGWCGKEISPRANGKGRPRLYCGRSCRQRAYEVRTAHQRLARDQAAGRARSEDEPVREVVREVVTRTRIVPSGPGAGMPNPWQRQEDVPASEAGPPRPRELQRLLARAAAAIAQGEYSHSAVERIMRGVSQVQTASDRYLDAVEARMRRRPGDEKRNRH